MTFPTHTLCGTRNTFGFCWRVILCDVVFVIRWEFHLWPGGERRGSLAPSVCHFLFLFVVFLPSDRRGESSQGISTCKCIYARPPTPMATPLFTSKFTNARSAPPASPHLVDPPHAPTVACRSSRQVADMQLTYQCPTRNERSRPR